MTLSPEFELGMLRPGDVIAVRTGGRAAGIIRFGERLRGIPDRTNHIVVVDSRDANDVLVGIEGRPGGVGRVDVAQYFEGGYGHYAVSNRTQPKSELQRSDVVAVVRNMLKVGYDWDAIAEDALNDLHIPELWLEKWHGTSPAHVVCSSLASWAYHKSGLAAPKQEDMRHIQPGDWAQFMLLHGWDQ